MIVFKEITKHGKTGLSVRGHADYAVKGADIVCAAVSAIAQTAYIGVQRFADIEPEPRCRDGDICFCSEKTLETVAIVVAALMGLREIAAQYPDNVTEMKG